MVELPESENVKTRLHVSMQYTNVTDRQTNGHRTTAWAALCGASHRKQEARRSQRDRATLPVIEYFAKSLKIIRNDTVA